MLYKGEAAVVLGVGCKLVVVGLTAIYLFLPLIIIYYVYLLCLLIILATRSEAKRHGSAYYNEVAKLHGDVGGDFQTQEV